MTTTSCGMSRPLNVAVAVVAIVMAATLFARTAVPLPAALVTVSVSPVATIARMERDDFLGGGRLGHDGGCARA